jgi:glutamyl-tRNA reductase
MEDILLIHKTANTNLKEPTLSGIISQSLTWKTCLRQISFLPPSHIHAGVLLKNMNAEDHGVEILKSEEALKFLIEILCGLHSPIVGETQVFGQFKLFADEMIQQGQPLFGRDNKWLQFIYHEVKEIRSQKLLGLGSQSYGSLLRKRIKDEKTVAIFGTGILAKEIIPYLAPTKKVQVFARNPDSIREFLKTYPGVELVTYEQALNAEALIVAAPIDDTMIVSKVNGGHCASPIIYDLRGEKNMLQVLHPRTVALKDLFDELNALKVESDSRVHTAKLDIRQRVHKYVMRAECRPFGWEDLCA